MSPYFAQRFDNGVLHVTVQNGRCRCMIAKAPGDPDAKPKTPEITEYSAAGLVPIKPLKCVWTGDENGKEKPCPPGKMNLKLWSLTAPEPPPLPSPNRKDSRGNWVKMMYRVQATKIRGESGIDVYADGKFIVRVRGLIGYTGGDPQPVKFKFGHYRAWRPGETRFQFDHFCMSERAKICDKDIQLIE